MNDTMTYMGYEWIAVEDGIVTVGLTDDAVSDLSEQITLNLPDADDSVLAGKICGDVESDNGNLNLYCPVSGTVIEVNDAVLENPKLLQEDPSDEGWLFKVEADDPDKLDRISLRAHSSDEDDHDEDDDDEEKDEEDDEEQDAGGGRDEYD